MRIYFELCCAERALVVASGEKETDNMRVLFNKERFIKEAQQNWYAPQFDKLQEGNLGEWFIALLFAPTLGLVWYSIVALSSTSIKLS